MPVQIAPVTLRRTRSDMRLRIIIEPPIQEYFRSFLGRLYVLPYGYLPLQVGEPYLSIPFGTVDNLGLVPFLPVTGSSPL